MSSDVFELPTHTLTLHEECELVPPMAEDEYSELLQSIRERGILVPLALVPGTRKVIDGRHRLKAALELNLPLVPCQNASLSDLSITSQIEYLVTVALTRRHLTASQRAAVVLRATERMREVAPASEGPGRASRRQALAELGGVSPRTIQDAKLVMDTSPELFERVARGELPAAKAARMARQAVARSIAATASGAEPDSERAIILEGDFRLVMPADRYESTIDCIFTDPPYPREYVDAGLYRDLAAWAARVLKPGGHLITYCNSLFMDRIMREMPEHLEWQFLLGEYESIKATVYERNVFVDFKPLLWFAKPPVKHDYPYFHCLAKAQEERAPRDLHHWAQRESTAKHFLSALLANAPGALVCDPMVGSGTTLTAALSLPLNLRVIGVDIDADAVATCRMRVTQALRSGGSENAEAEAVE